jgi:hypothetical protein
LSAGALPSLRDTIARHGLDARKSLGQHFLLDEALCGRIAALAGDLAGRQVLEVGPGPGGLTRALLASPAAAVTAVELDRRAVAALAELEAAKPGRLRVIEADALTVDPTTLMPTPRKIVANLPYNVASPLLVGWLRRAAGLEGMTLMFQQGWPSGSAPRRTRRPMVGWRCCRSGAAAARCCFGCRRAPSRRRPRCIQPWSASSRIRRTRAMRCSGRWSG